MNIVCSWNGCNNVLGTTDSLRGSWGFICATHLAHLRSTLASTAGVPLQSQQDVLDLKPQPDSGHTDGAQQ